MNDFLANLQLDLDEILSDLVTEGVLTEEQHDTFNIPVYDRNIDDVKAALECCGSMFNVVITKMHKFDLPLLDTQTGHLPGYVHRLR
ncbi:unnamed protein product [Calypogeia fissa]